MWLKQRFARVSALVLVGMVVTAAAFAADLKPVKLKMILLMDAEPDAKEVHAAFNELTKQDLKAEVEIEHLSSDWKDKYNLMLAAGEEVDVVFSAKWAAYPELARDGAFLPLDDLLPEYAPSLWNEMSATAWEHAKVDGSIYMVPKNDVDFPNHGFLYRLDWAEKYGIGKLETIDDLWQYFEAVQQNENVIPYNIAGKDFGHFMHNVLDLLGFDYKPRKDIGASLQVDVHDLSKPPIPFWEAPQFQTLLQYTRQGYEKGFWSKNVLANKNPIRDAFEKGISGSTWVNPKQANETWLKVKDAFPDAAWDYLDATADYPVYERKSVAVAGMSIAATSPNPERGLMLIEKLHQDCAYNRMLTYGLEGKHWVLDEDGHIMLPEGVTMDTSGWQWDKPNPWGFRDNKCFLTDPVQQAGAWDVVREVWQKYSDNYIFDPSYTFAFDKTPVSAEAAALDTVMDQYFLPLLWGVVDPEEGYKEFIAKMDQAGYQKVRAEVEKQWNAYLGQ